MPSKRGDISFRDFWFETTETTPGSFKQKMICFKGTGGSGWPQPCPGTSVAFTLKEDLFFILMCLVKFITYNVMKRFLFYACFELFEAELKDLRGVL